MLNHSPFNHGLLGGNNRGFALSEAPSYSPSLITAVAHVQQGVADPKFIMAGVGGADEYTHKVFKKGTSYAFNLWQSGRFSIGKPFNIQRIEIPLSAAPTTDTLIVPILDFDDGNRRVAGNEISLEKYLDGQQTIVLTPYNFDMNVHGNRNFCLEFQFRGIDLLAVSLPIKIEIETETNG